MRQSYFLSTNGCITIESLFQVVNSEPQTWSKPYVSLIDLQSTLAYLPEICKYYHMDNYKKESKNSRMPKLSIYYVCETDSSGLQLLQLALLSWHHLLFALKLC